jgi:hypothetical protein
MNELDKLYNFMKKYQIYGKNLPYTHVMLYEPYGSYNIPDQVYGKFISLYTDALAIGYDLHIAERHKNIGPIIIDLDFVQYNGNRHYTTNTIDEIVATYNSIIKHYLDTDTNLKFYINILSCCKFNDGIWHHYMLITTTN